MNTALHHRRQQRGLETAKRFVEEGAFVFISGRRKTGLDAAVAGGADIQ
jgi:short-subunit dehydrogenase involved in D-alanine esterification of teichoic acids